MGCVNDLLLVCIYNEFINEYLNKVNILKCC